MKGSVTIGARRHVVTVQNPVAPSVSGNTGEPTTETWANAVPSTWHCSIEPATTRDLERVAATSVIAQATHILRGRYHPQITTKSRLVFGTRYFSVSGIGNLEERNIDMEVVASEVVV